MDDPQQTDDRARGLDAFQRREYREAIVYLAQAATDPRDVQARCLLGFAQHYCGMNAAALATLNTAVRDAPHDPEVYHHRALLLRDLGAIAEARADLEQTLRLQPGHPQAAELLAALRAQCPQTARSLAPPPARPAIRVSIPLLVAGILLSGVFAVGMFIGISGVSRLRLERTYPTQQVLSYAQFIRQKPTKGWFRITGAALSLQEASWLESQKYHHAVSNVHVPVRGLDEDPAQEPIHILVATYDPSIQETVQQIADRQRAGQDAILEREIREHPEKFWIEGDVEGLIATAPPVVGLSDLDAHNNRAVAAQTHLAPDCVIFEAYDRAPGLGRKLLNTGLGLCGGSLGLGLAIAGPAWLQYRKRRRRDLPSPPASSAAP